MLFNSLNSKQILTDVWSVDLKLEAQLHKKKKSGVDVGLVTFSTKSRRCISSSETMPEICIFFVEAKKPLRLSSHSLLFTERLCFVSTCRVYHLKPLSCFRKPADGVELRGWESRRSSKLSNNEAADKIAWTRFLTSIMLNSNSLPFWRYVFVLTEALQHSLLIVWRQWINQYPSTILS